MQEQTESPEAVFAQRMRQQREYQQLSQSQMALELAALTGVKLDATAITRMEKGTRTIRLNEAVGIAYVLDVSLIELVAPDLADVERVQRAERAAQMAHARAASAAKAAKLAEAHARKVRREAEKAVTNG